MAARKEYTTAYFIEQGTLLRWSFRVQDKDIGFGVRIRKMQDFGGSELLVFMMILILISKSK